MDDQNVGIFFLKLGYFFQFSKKGRVDLPPVPSSYAPENPDSYSANSF